jgi:hypothetical protein
MVSSDHGPVARIKKIVEKNTAKGQGSLATFFAPKDAAGAVKSNKASFTHYAI